MPVMIQTVLHGKWPLYLPPHRATISTWTEPPYWEKQRIESMHANLKPGDVIFDIGAEEGDMPALWASWGCSVVVVEPDPRVWPNIKAIFEANHLEDRLLDYFVGFASDRTMLDPPHVEPLIAQPPIDGWPACAYGDIIGDHGFRTVWERAHDTPQITIDDLAYRRTTSPDAITMDIEGAELWALRGAERTLKERRPLTWVSEHWDFMKTYGYQPEDLHAFMKDCGYERHFIVHDHETHALYRPRERTDVVVPE